eukprot:13574972-Alexandrium_andersonii.AAC.1
MEAVLATMPGASYPDHPHTGLGGRCAPLSPAQRCPRRCPQWQPSELVPRFRAPPGGVSGGLGGGA